MSKPRKERPRAERIPFQILVVYTHGNAQVTRFCSNLSEGGIFIETLDAFSIGTELDVKFSFPMDKREVAVKARVAWIREPSGSEGPGMGLEFMNLDPANRAMILRAIEFLKTLGEN